MKKLTNRKIRIIVRKLLKSCTAGDYCHQCATNGEYCPHAKAFAIMDWWYERTGYWAG